MINWKRIALLVAVFIDVCFVLILVFIFSVKALDKPVTTMPAQFKNFVVLAPMGVTVTEPQASSTQPILKLETEKGKVALFEEADFNNGQPTWVYPEFNTKSNQWLPSEPTEEERLERNGRIITVWYFYDANDLATKEELKKMVNSIKEVRY